MMIKGEERASEGVSRNVEMAADADWLSPMLLLLLSRCAEEKRFLVVLRRRCRCRCREEAMMVSRIRGATQIKEQQQHRLSEALC